MSHFIKEQLLTFRFIGVILSAGTVVALATLLGFLGRFWWAFDLFSNFRVQYFVTLLLITGLLFVLHKRSTAAIFGGFAILNFLVIVPLYFGGQESGSGPGFRAVLINVNTTTGDPVRVEQFLRQQDPDLIVLEEVSYTWISKLSDLMKAYPYSVVQTREDNFGIALYSKYPIGAHEILELADSEVPTIVAEVASPSGKLTVIATHPLPPAGPEYSHRRDNQLAALPELVQKAVSPVLLLGDLNVTPWSYHYGRLLKESGLLDSTQGRGVQPSWPTTSFLFWIPLDQCLHSPSIHILSRKIGPQLGSDHYPLLIELFLMEQKPIVPSS